MEKFRIQNIKSFKDSGDISIKPITVFVGKNSCGKSSLLRFLAVISQTFTNKSDSPIRFYGDLVDYGTFEEVVHMGGDENIKFSLTFNIDVAQSSHLKIFEGHILKGTDKNQDFRDVELDVLIGKTEKKLVVLRVSVLYDGKLLYDISKIDVRKYKFDIKYVYKDGRFEKEEYSLIVDNVQLDRFVPRYYIKDMFSAIVAYVSKNQSILDDEYLKELYKRIRRYSEVDQDYSEEEKRIIHMTDAFEYASDLLSNLYDECEMMAGTLHYIGPFRMSPDRVYRDPEYNSRDVGANGENLSSVLMSDYHKESKLISKVSEALNDLFGYKKVQIKNIGTGFFQIMVEDEKGLQTNIIDTGFGVSQVLPVVTQVAKCYQKKVVHGLLNKKIQKESILIEQPELHLHPAAQAELADLFVDCVLQNRDCNIIVETHSEHLIRKLQVLIADKSNELSNEMVKVYYVDKDEDGVADVREMKIAHNGKFEEKWPSGFFDKGYQLSLKLSEAIYNQGQ